MTVHEAAAREQSHKGIHAAPDELLESEASEAHKRAFEKRRRGGEYNEGEALHEHLAVGYPDDDDETKRPQRTRQTSMH